jgi:hypothetical protein
MCVKEYHTYSCGCKKIGRVIKCKYQKELTDLELHPNYSATHPAVVKNGELCRKYSDHLDFYREQNCSEPCRWEDYREFLGRLNRVFRVEKREDRSEM